MDARLSFGAIAVLLLLGCSSPRHEQAKSGSRLRAEFVRAEDDERAVRFEAFHDRELDLTCTPTALVDGGFACLPRMPVALNYVEAYGDARCTVPAYGVSTTPCSDCDERFVRVDATNGCGVSPGLPTREVRRVLGPSASTAWFFVQPDGGCLAANASQDVVLLRTEPLPESYFVTFRVTPEPRGALTARRARSGDGAEVVVNPAVEGLEEASAEQVCPGLRRWLPRVQTFLSAPFSDATCSRGTAFEVCDPGARFALGDTGDSCSAGTPARARVGSRVPGFSRSEDGGCSPYSGPSVLVLEATPIPDDDFPVAEPLTLGTERLRVSGWTDSRGGVIAPGLEFVDSVHGWKCDPVDTGASGLRCLPRVAPWPPGARPTVVYRDASCLEPVWPPDTSESVLQLNDGAGRVALYKVGQSATWSSLYVREPGSRCTFARETGVQSGRSLELLANDSFVKLVRFTD